MSIEALYRGYGVRIHSDDFDPAEVLGAISQFSVPDDVDVEREVTDGGIFPTVTSLTQHKEKFDLTSLNVDRVIDIVGSVGACMKGVSTQTGFELFLSKIDRCTPGVDVSAVNLRLAAKSSTTPASSVFGMLTPGQLVANHGANASMSFMMTPQALSGNAAIVATSGVALPVIADTKSRFTLAENFTLNGIAIKAKKSININFNVGLLLEGADGSLAPEWVSIENLMAVITITGVNPEWAVNVPRNGKVFAHANTTFYLRQRKPDSTTGFWADVDAKHIKCTAAGKAFITNIASGQGNRPVESALVMYVEFDGTNAPIILNTLQAIV